MSDDGGGFLSRWSRRKAEVLTPSPSGRGGGEGPRSGEVAVASPSPPPSPQRGEGESSATVATPPPAPTLEDVAQLTRDSSYARFVTPNVPLDVKNAAMKKLFTDPHFNIMDGLDTYIEDYGIADPIPEAMLRQMAQSKFLGLFDHEEAEPEAAPLTLPPPPPPDENADLRLQQDDAAGRPGARPGAGAGERG